MEKESYGGGFLIEMESSGEQSSQPRLLATWRSNCVLTDIGEVSNGMAMRLAIKTDIGNVVPLGDVSILDHQQVEILPHISSPLLEMLR